MYAPMHILMGLNMMSVSIRVFTSTHPLRRAPNVSLKNSKQKVKMRDFSRASGVGEGVGGVE